MTLRTQSVIKMSEHMSVIIVLTINNDLNRIIINSQK